MKFRLSMSLMVTTSLAITALVISRPTAVAQEPTEPLPMVSAAQVPLYPQVARLTNTQEVIHVRVTTDGHRVKEAHAAEDLKPLSDAAEENAKTWQFVLHTPVSFTITYRYKLSDQCNPNNPTVTLRLPTDVEVCQYPFHEY